MTYYVMGEITLTDTHWVRAYLRDINGFITKHGGFVLSRSINMETIEGERSPPTNVILLAFPTRAAAHAFFDDPAYRPMRDLRRAGSRCDFVGFPAEDLAEDGRAIPPLAAWGGDNP